MRAHDGDLRVSSRWVPSSNLHADDRRRSSLGAPRRRGRRGTRFDRRSCIQMWPLPESRTPVERTNVTCPNAISGHRSTRGPQAGSLAAVAKPRNRNGQRRHRARMDQQEGREPPRANFLLPPNLQNDRDDFSVVARRRSRVLIRRGIRTMVLKM
jgi:hypothetical protein